MIRRKRHLPNEPALPKTTKSMAIQRLMNCFVHSPNRAPRKKTKTMMVSINHAPNLKVVGVN
jgi:hypothetical protein